MDISKQYLSIPTAISNNHKNAAKESTCVVRKELKLVCEPTVVSRRTLVQVLSQPELSLYIALSLHHISAHHINDACPSFELGHALLLWQVGRRLLNCSRRASGSPAPCGRHSQSGLSFPHLQRRRRERVTAPCRGPPCVQAARFLHRLPLEVDMT